MTHLSEDLNGIKIKAELTERWLGGQVEYSIKYGLNPRFDLSNGTRAHDSCE